MGRWYDFVVGCVGVPLFKGLLQARLTGAEIVPASGPAIIAANHLGGPDMLVIPALLHRPMVYPAKAELFEGKGIKWFLSAWLRSMGQVPVDRSGGDAALAGLRPLADVLEEGGVVGIFPEGTRSPDGRLYRGHTGVARLALATGAPVYPVGTQRTHIRRSCLRPTMKQARLVFGQPLDFSHLRDRADDPAVWRWVTNEVMTAIQAISGQTYVDVYASRIKHGELSPSQAEAYRLPHPNDATAWPGPADQRAAEP